MIRALHAGEDRERGALARVGCVSLARAQDALRALGDPLVAWSLERWSLDGFFDTMAFEADVALLGPPIQE